MLKYASAQIMTAVMAPQDAGRRELRRFSHRHHFSYEVRPGYLYVRSRAISSRCNDNFDEFPAEELEKGYRTFIGKPVFVNHSNEDHRRARGVIIDAVLHKDSNRDGTKDWWVEVLQEVDALRFPRLAAEILNGNIARTSMGTDVSHSICSACGNRATTPAEYCTHIPASKGMMLYRTTASGQKVGEVIRETCYGLKFFENSLLVEPPADPTAYFTGVDDRGLKGTAIQRDQASRAADPFFYASTQKTAAQVPGLSWDEVGERHPEIYGDSEIHGERAEGADGEMIGSAANDLAHSTPDDPDAEAHSIHDLTFHRAMIDPHAIDHKRNGISDGRVASAIQGYREHPEQMPPVVLVHRHGVFQVADGHHRTEAAKAVGMSKIPAYVTKSPYPRTPSGWDAKGPYHGAETTRWSPPQVRPRKDPGQTPESSGYTQDRMFEAAKKDPRFAEVGLKQDDKGHYVTTHRARSDSYPTPEAIPQSVVDKIAATGSRTTLDELMTEGTKQAAQQYPNPADHPWFKEAGLSHENVIHHWDLASPEEKAQGKRWYPDAHLVARSIARLDTRIKTDKEAAHKGGGVLSAYSPQQNWWANQHNAARSFHEQRALGKGEGIMIMASHAKAAQRIMDGEDSQKVLKGPKTSDFASLIEHGGNDEHGNPSQKVVVDRHALSVAAGRRLKADDVNGFPSQSRHYYEHAAEHYRRAAAVISDREGRTVPPHEVQATTWLVRQRLNAEQDSSPGQKGRDSLQRKHKDEWQGLTHEHAPELHEPPTNSHVAGANGDLPEGLHFTYHGGPDYKYHVLRAHTPDYKQAGKLEWTKKREEYWDEKGPADFQPDKQCDHCNMNGHGDSWHVKPAGHINWIGVVPEYQRRGVASAMLDHAAANYDPAPVHTAHTTDSGKGLQQSRSAVLPNDSQRLLGRKLAYGEQRAPEDVDTLREDACPVCGDRDAFNGATCQVCGYVAPPKMFQDPDLEKARQMDLRKDIAEFNDPASPDQLGPDGQPVANPMDPAALDENGNPVNPDAADQQAQPGTLPGEVQAEVQPGGDPMGGGSPMDPDALGQDGQIPEEMGAPVDPAMLGPDGQPLQQPGQQQMVGPDGMPIGPQALPPDATTSEGQPFTPGPDMPQGPGQPAGPQGPAGPEDLDQDGQIPNPDAGQGVPGTPGDGVPDLQCPACGFTVDATAPVSVDMDTSIMPPSGQATPDGVQAGDVCPNCGTAQLISPAEGQGEVPPPMPAQI
jgi:ribosomal protein S18 acetylase RimI-like enzyme